VDAFAQWRNLDPARAAARIHETAARLPGRSAALSLLPGRPELERRFELAADERPLAGIPFVVKDLYDAAGEPTRAGSSFLDKVRPLPKTDAALLRDARHAGLVCVGRSHLHEFAYGLTGENIWHGDCPHPFHPGRLAGGSSSGSAWAVGTGLVPLAFGTDTAGSVRVPAAWCGLHGVRWTQNAWIRDGVFPLAPSYDAAGWFTADAAGMAAMLRDFGPSSGPDAGLERSGNPPRVAWLEPPAGLVREDLLHASRKSPSGPLPGRRTASRDSAGGGGRAAVHRPPRAYTILQSREAFRIHEAWLDARKADYDPRVWALLDRGRHWNNTDIAGAEAGQERIRAVFAACLTAHDLVAMPVVPAPAPAKAEATPDLRARLLALNTPCSLARLPALTLPVPLPGGFHAGIQFLSPPQRMGAWLHLLPGP
jgi:aspartyl-tRNA(Asn)/glutamyl-tRNA(Gln) amidotransferase subunit A